jgi:electron transport complex protein RnfG
MEKPKTEKRASSLGNMILGLGLVALVASGLLALVYSLTKEPIALAKAKKLNEAIQLVSPEFNNDPAAEKYLLAIEDNDSIVCYPIREDGALVATAIRSYSDEGFSGRFYVMVGFDVDGKIIDTRVLEHSETPGLGDKMEKRKSDWSNQFSGKDPAEFKLTVSKDGGDVDGITAATISSRAFCNAVDQAYTAYLKDGKHE